MRCGADPAEFQQLLRADLTDEDGRVRVEVVRTLVWCGGDRAELQPLLVGWLTSGLDLVFDTLGTILDVATPESAPALRELAERDKRVYRSSDPFGGGWEDDVLRDMLWEAADRLSGTGPAGGVGAQGT